MEQLLAGFLARSGQNGYWQQQPELAAAPPLLDQDALLTLLQRSNSDNSTEHSPPPAAASSLSPPLANKKSSTHKRPSTEIDTNTPGQSHWLSAGAVSPTAKKQRKLDGPAAAAAAASSSLTSDLSSFGSLPALQPAPVVAGTGSPVELLLLKLHLIQQERVKAEAQAAAAVAAVEAIPQNLLALAARGNCLRGTTDVPATSLGRSQLPNDQSSSVLAYEGEGESSPEMATPQPEIPAANLVPSAAAAPAMDLFEAAADGTQPCRLTFGDADQAWCDTILDMDDFPLDRVDEGDSMGVDDILCSGLPPLDANSNFVTTSSIVDQLDVQLVATQKDVNPAAAPAAAAEPLPPAAVKVEEPASAELKEEVPLPAPVHAPLVVPCAKISPPSSPKYPPLPIQLLQRENFSPESAAAAATTLSTAPLPALATAWARYEVQDSAENGSGSNEQSPSRTPPRSPQDKSGSRRSPSLDAAANSNNTEEQPKKRRQKRGTATDPQSLAARGRRERIATRIKTLHDLVPGGGKLDTATMLDQAIQYVRNLQQKVEAAKTRRMEAPSGPAPAAPSASPALLAY